MEYFILDNSWFFLWYVLRIVGFCAFTRDEENCKIIPRTQIKIWIHFICITGTICIICSSAHYVQLIHLIMNTETAYNDLLKISFEIFLSGQTTSLVSIFITIVLNSICWITVFKLSDLAVGLSEFQDYYTYNNRHVFINVKNVAKQFKKVYLYTLLNLLLWTVFSVLFCICLSSEVRRRINISLDWNVMLTFGYTVIFILIYFCPVAYFFFIYCEIILLLSEWCICIMNIENQNLMIKQAKLFIYGLNFIEKKFSYFLFWLTLVFVIGIVGKAYYIFVPFLDQDRFAAAADTWQYMTFSMVASYISATILLYNLCSYSELMANKVQELKRKILENIQFQNGEADATLTLLDEFKGFNANGYFTLNHSLLTSLTSSFICFFVILIQFKQSESNNINEGNLEFCYKLINQSTNNNLILPYGKN